MPALTFVPERLANGWMLSPEERLPGYFYLRMFPPVPGCTPLIVVKSFTRQKDLLRFHEIIKSLPAHSKKHVAPGEFPILDTWQNYANGWSCKIKLYATVQDISSGLHRYILWIKTPPEWSLQIGLWKFAIGRISIKAAYPLHKEDVERFLEYFRSI